MSALYVIGRILFALLFVVSGINKFLDLQGATQAITTHFAVPAQLLGYATQVETFTGMPIAQLIAILGGVLEVVGGLAIATNFAARTFAVLLAIFLAVTLFHFHDFWNATAPDRTAGLFEALKDLALIGALLMIAGRSRDLAAPGPSYTDI
jgi:uncharacterized membrane protein YphA (DoxX/SURF4 family)